MTQTHANVAACRWVLCIFLLVDVAGCGDVGGSAPPLANVAGPATTLDDAIKAGSLADVKAKLQRGGRLDPRSKEALAAAAMAVTQDQVEVMRWLLSEGLDPNALDDEGRPLLFRAAAQAGGPMVELLLAQGAHLSSRDRLGQSALHVAVGASRRAAVESLLLNSADVAARDRSGLTPLHAGLAADPAILELLIIAGADVNNADVRGSTPLHRAAAMGNAKLIDWLIAKGAKVNARNTSGFTPLALARTEVRETLKRQGAKE